MRWFAVLVTLVACGEGACNREEEPGARAPGTSSALAASEFPCSQEPPPDTGPFGGRVALTFDDGPSPSTTPAVMQALRDAGVPATFFVSGAQLESAEARALAREIHRDPLFIVANHAYSHPRFDELSIAEAREEVDRTSQAIRKALGDPCYFPRFFRFPYGASNCATMKVVRERGLSPVGVHVDSLDWCFDRHRGHCARDDADWLDDRYRDDMVELILREVTEHSGGIVLMHDTRAYTAKILPRVITRLRQAGTRFVRLDDPAVYPAINANVRAPEPPASCGERVRW